MGKLSTLLAWHEADPVDAGEELQKAEVRSQKSEVRGRNGKATGYVFPEAAAMYESNPYGITGRVKKVLRAALTRLAKAETEPAEEKEPEVPELGITLGTDGIVLSGLATNQSRRLEFAMNLRPAEWQDAPVTPGLSNGQFVVRWTNAVPRVFFRLRAW